ncbi:unnamed protein product [Chrysodeixis includens]|uniref:Uncharacterized protein n=1 Tax=Chrysodeixis includens TaxID=689277 RepID=A0A9N8KWT4_CHRIL|nr:unnamed protein product [Chrysodeixis includens]
MLGARFGIFDRKPTDNTNGRPGVTPAWNDQQRSTWRQPGGNSPNGPAEPHNDRHGGTERPRNTHPGRTMEATRSPTTDRNGRTQEHGKRRQPRPWTNAEPRNGGTRKANGAQRTTRTEQENAPTMSRMRVTERKDRGENNQER